MERWWRDCQGRVSASARPIAEAVPYPKLFGWLSAADRQQLHIRDKALQRLEMRPNVLREGVNDTRGHNELHAVVPITVQSWFLIDDTRKALSREDRQSVADAATAHCPA